MSPGTPASLQEELHQKLPFRSAAHEASIALLRTADRVQRELARTISRQGITFQQYNVLRILRGAEPDGLPTLSIAERMIEQAPGITRLIDRLEAKDLVSRGRRSGDRRCVLCRITRRGLDLLAALDQPIAATDQQLFARLDPAETARLIELLGLLRSSVHEKPHEASPDPSRD